MGIIALAISSRQQANGLIDPDGPVCPVVPGHHLVKNGHYWRHADVLPSNKLLSIQRYQCRACGTTYSALPYDLRPYSRATWAVTLAAGLLWRVEHGWTVADCLRWLDSHGFLYHQRTLERWAARWQTALPVIVQAAVQWIARHHGTRAVAAFPGHDEASWQHWRRLWHAVRPSRGMGHGGWLGTSVLWGWLSITVFAGLSPAGG